MLHRYDSARVSGLVDPAIRIASAILSESMDRPLLFGVSRLTMMSNGQYQHELFRGQPAVLGNVAITAAQQNEFTTPVFGISTQ